MHEARPARPPGAQFEFRLPVGQREVRLIGYPFEHAGEAAVLLALSSPKSLPLELPASSLDPVTQLPDRRALDRRLDSLADVGAPTPGIALLFVDLDGFKLVNDREGHLVGDEVLATVARRLSQAIRAIDFIARFGGDEFVVLVQGIDSPQKLAPLVERLRSAAQQQIETPSGQISLSASIGVALSGEGFSNPRQMLAAADTRMYAQKRAAQ
jgi:diguanylate cyclase (GGDEF)-like protein